MIGSKQSNKEERSSTNLHGKSLRLALYENPKTSPLIMLITLFYTDQKSSNQDHMNLGIRVIRGPSSEICFFGKSRATVGSSENAMIFGKTMQNFALQEGYADACSA